MPVDIVREDFRDDGRNAESSQLLSAPCTHGESLLCVAIELFSKDNALVHRLKMIARLSRAVIEATRDTRTWVTLLFGFPIAAMTRQVAAAR
jgi:hypothetical protein